MRLLDLFCGAGGCSVGYRRAGFGEVVGVDKRWQPNYPYYFVQGDALAVLRRLINGDSIRPHVLDEVRPGPFNLSDFDFIHASPPCQAYSVTKTLKHNKQGSHPDLVDPTRDLLIKSRLPWVIENVPGSPLHNPVVLCGSSFNLDVRRHRLFESNLRLRGLPCRHEIHTPRFPSDDCRYPNRRTRVVSVYGGSKFIGHKRLRRKAMQISWMSETELNQAIPPAYTEFLGGQILKILQP